MRVLSMLPSLGACLSLVLLSLVLRALFLFPLGGLHYHPDMKRLRYDTLLAAEGKTYPVCASLGKLRDSLDSHLGTPGLQAAIESGEVYCGKERSLLRRNKIPWSGCWGELPAGKRRVLGEIERLCADQAVAVGLVRTNGSLPHLRPSTRGVVLTGHKQHFQSIYRVISNLRNLNCSLPVEVFVDPDLLSACTLNVARHFSIYADADTDGVGRGVRCRALPGRTVGYVAKFHALLLSSFAEALFLNAGAILLRSPEEVFESEPFRATGAVLWPDIWGEQCRLNINNSTASPAIGQTAWSTHVLTKAGVAGLEWRPERVWATEAETSIMAFDMRRHDGVLELGRTLKDDDRFFAHTMHGDKDIFRLALLMTHTPFHFVPHLPAVATHEGGLVALAHFHGTDPAPLLFSHSRVRSREAYGHLYRLKDELLSLSSVCAHAPFSSDRYISYKAYDVEATVRFVEALRADTDLKWSRIMAAA